MTIQAIISVKDSCVLSFISVGRQSKHHRIMKQEVTSCGQATWALNTLVAKKESSTNKCMEVLGK